MNLNTTAARLHTENYFVCIRWSICFSRTPLHVPKNFIPTILPGHITGLQSSSHLMSLKHRCKENHIGNNLSYQSFGKITQDTKYYFLGCIQNVRTAKLECLSVREPRRRKDFSFQLKDSWKSGDVLRVNDDSTKNHQASFSNRTRWSSSTSQLQVTRQPWSCIAGGPLEQRDSRLGPAAPGFSAPREIVGFQTQLETTHEHFISLTATFGPWRTLGKFLSEGYHFHW